MGKIIGFSGGTAAEDAAKLFSAAGYEAVVFDDKKILEEGTAVGESQPEAFFELSEQDSYEHKCAVMAALDEALPETSALLVSTVFLNVNRLAAAASHRERVIPLHLVSLESCGGVIETVKTMVAAPELYEDAKQLLGTVFHEVVDAPDALGGIYYRLLPLMPNMSAELIASGTIAEDIDKAMIYGTNFTSGPLEMADRFGLDRIVRLLSDLYEETKNQAYRPSEFLISMVAAGKLGAASGEGFYVYG